MTLRRVLLVQPGGGGGVIEDSYQLKLLTEDSVTVPDDVGSFAIALGLADEGVSPTEALQLGFPAGDFNDDATAPTEGKTFVLRIWLSANASSGGAPVNTPNADGQNNGTLATIETNVLGAAVEGIVSAVGANVPADVILSSVIYRGWFKSVNTLITSKGEVIADSLPVLFSGIIMFANAGLNTTVDRLDGSFTFDLLGAGVDTVAKLQAMRVFHRTTDAVAGVTPHVLTVDAGCIEMTGAFS